MCNTLFSLIQVEPTLSRSQSDTTAGSPTGLTDMRLLLGSNQESFTCQPNVKTTRITIYIL